MPVSLAAYLGTLVGSCSVCYRVMVLRSPLAALQRTHLHGRRRPTQQRRESCPGACSLRASHAGHAQTFLSMP